MVQPQETHRPPLRTVVESYVSVTGATYAAKAGDQLIGVNHAGTVTVTLPTARLSNTLKLVAIDVASCVR